MSVTQLSERKKAELRELWDVAETASEKWQALAMSSRPADPDKRFEADLAIRSAWDEMIEAKMAFEKARNSMAEGE